MLEVQIKTSLPESCVLGALDEILTHAIMEVEGLTEVNDEIKGLLSVRARKIEDIIENLPSYCEGISVSSKEAKVLVKEHTCLLAHSIIASGCLITKANLDGRKIIWNVVCDYDSFLRLMRNLEETEVEFEILYKGRPIESGRKSKITYREEEILKIALEKGFFDFPKQIKLEELAEIFGIAPSTLSEILRRGQKKVLKNYFGLGT
ncbi:bacterio-opsin activator [Archaeoglobales archaeon]|nr:MAG: bacterio-opsin activator [Archaeoglobales archaeon]